MPEAEGLHLSVDGMTPSGPNLSHWPGNRTPLAWKADLSTGICLKFARAERAAQEQFLAGATVVLNDHYDTDGFGSLLAVLHPDVALPREELLLAAAATGDFGTLQTWRGFAIDRIVAHLATPASPVHRTFAGLSGSADHPEAFAQLYQDELALVQEQIDAGLRGAATRTRHRDLGCCTVTTNGPLHRMALNTLAGAYRVLHVQNSADGPSYRYHDRTESWFELLTIQSPLRRDLRPLAQTLGALEPPRDGAQWCADAPNEPIPELYFGIPATQEYGQTTRQLRPSALPPATVERALLRHFAEQPPA
jgi:hypothetical protein